MIYEITLIKEKMVYDLIDIIDKHTDNLDDEHKKIVLGVKYMEKELGTTLTENGENFYMYDVNLTLNNIVSVLTTLEDSGVLSLEDGDTFNSYCTKILEAQEIECSNHINIGNIIIADDGYPYQICEIDYDDFSVKLWDGDEMNFGHWESPLKCKSKV